MTALGVRREGTQRSEHRIVVRLPCAHLVPLELLDPVAVEIMVKPSSLNHLPP